MQQNDIAYKHSVRCILDKTDFQLSLRPNKYHSLRGIPILIKKSLDMDRSRFSRLKSLLIDGGQDMLLMEKIIRIIPPL